MTTIKVPDMMCENCVKRITNALTAAELTFRVDLAAKNVSIDGCENCVKTAVTDCCRLQPAAADGNLDSIHPHFLP